MRCSVMVAVIDREADVALFGMGYDYNDARAST